MFKKLRNRNFSKAVNPWIFLKIGRFSIFFFQVILARKMCFMIFQNEKTHFYAIKTRILKSRKIDIFAKGLTHGFAQKLAIFPSFFFKAIQARKMCFMIFQKEKTLFQAIKTLKNWSFFHLFFLDNIGQENVFYDILK